MPAEDDGSRDDPLLSDRSGAVSDYRPDVHGLSQAPTRIVIAVGEETGSTFTGRTSAAIADLLGQHPTVFPSHHGGFLGSESGYPGSLKRSPVSSVRSSTASDQFGAAPRFAEKA